jgi:BioD-like phosphotransacetylase family protein
MRYGRQLARNNNSRRLLHRARQLSSSSTSTSAAASSTAAASTSSSAATCTDESRNSSHNNDSNTSPRRPIYVAATRQNVGKTSVSLALMSGLIKRFDKVGFMKPVGQVSLTVTDNDEKNYVVDKDAALIKQHFQLHHIAYSDTSPVLIPPGYTKDYLDGKITNEHQMAQIQRAFERVQASSAIVLCEGTGHCAVGSIVQASNASVANLLGARMVLVANGGIGAAFDELALNHNLCVANDVEIAGVVINKVKVEKYDQTKTYLQKVLHERWNIPLLGCIPDRPFLGCPALADLERLFPGSTLVSGSEHSLRHYSCQDMNLVAKSLNVFLKNLKKNPKRTLYVCHASRNDILLGFLMESQHRTYRDEGEKWETAMVVTGCHEYPISKQVLDIVTSMESAPPVLLAPQPTRTVMEGIYNYTPKLNMADNSRVATTVAHYERYIDFDLLLERVGRVDDVTVSAA